MKRFLILCLMYCSLTAQAQFRVQDIRIGDTTVSYIDFEFWQQGNRICFQDQNNRGYIGLMDSLSGNLVNTGREFPFDMSLAPITQSINGPEWGLRRGGADVFYTRQTGNNRSIGKATWNGNSYAITDLSASLPGRRFATVCSKNSSDSVASLVYALGNNIANFTIKYSPAINPVSDIPVPYGANSTSGPRFVDGERALLTNDLVAGSTQIFKYNLDSASLQQITFDSGSKTDAFIFNAPDFNNRKLLFCTVNSNQLRLYEEISGSFIPMYNINIPDTSYHYYFSAEPFIFRGNSYLFVCAADIPFIPGSQSNSRPADVWIVGLGQTEPFFRKVSDSRVALRLDPEVFVTPNEAFVYYYEYKENGNVHPVSLHKCSAGLGQFPLLSESDFVQKSNYKIYPNPFVGNIKIQTLKGNEYFELLNSFGQLLWSGSDIEKQDFSILKGGIYFLKIQGLKSSNTFKVIKN